MGLLPLPATSSGFFSQVMTAVHLLAYPTLFLLLTEWTACGRQPVGVLHGARKPHLHTSQPIMLYDGRVANARPCAWWLKQSHHVPRSHADHDIRLKSIKHNHQGLDGKGIGFRPPQQSTLGSPSPVLVELVVLVAPVLAWRELIPDAAHSCLCWLLQKMKAMEQAHNVKHSGVNW
jgi:hypothetical protein